MEDLAVKSIPYATYWFLAGVVPVLFMFSVLFYSVAWQELKDRLQGDWLPSWSGLLGSDRAGDPNLLVWFLWHVVVVAVLAVAAVLSPATDLAGMALLAAELWAVVLIVLALLVIRDAMPWRLAAAHAVVWLVRLQVVLFVVGLALFNPDDFTQPYQ
jgi:hypothetical protein